MSDTKTKPTATSNQLRTLAQNVRLCADILVLTLETVAKEAKVPVSLLSSFEDGVGVLTPDMLERLASELRLTKLQLLRAGPLETRRSIFEALLHPERPIEVPDDDLDRSLLRGSKRKETLLGVGKAHDDDDAEGEAAESSDESGPNPTAPEAEQSEPSEAPTEVLEASTAEAEIERAEALEELTRRQRFDVEIDWGRSSYCGNYKGRTYNLKDNRVRRSVSQRLKDIKGSRTSAQLAEVVEKSSSWISNLYQGAGDLDRSHLELLATYCQTSVVFLLTGKNPGEEVRDV